MRNIIYLIKQPKKRWKRLFLLLIILMLSFSAFCVIFGLIDAFKYKIQLDNQGVKIFIHLFSGYGTIISSSFALLGLYLVLEQISNSSQANKINSRNEWRKKLDEKLDIIRNKNSYLYEFINLIADDLYEDLLDFDMKINSKEQLYIVFDKFLKVNISRIEQQSQKYIEMGGNYKTIPADMSYSFPEFEEFLYRLFKPSWLYKSFYNDFKELYIAEVRKFSADKKTGFIEYEMNKLKSDLSKEKK